MAVARCVHCLIAVDGEGEADHWFPRSWYPSTTPADLEKWSFPSCPKCNRELGAIEDRLRHRLLLGVDPQTAGARGLVDSALRSLDPGRGKGERDRRARAARRAALERHLTPARQLPLESVLPGFGPHADQPLDEQVGTVVAADDLHRFVHKLVKGLTYLQLGCYLDEAHVIDVRLYRPGDAKRLTDPLDSHGQAVDRGPGIRARFVRGSRDPLCAAYEFTIWDKLTVYALVLPQD